MAQWRGPRCELRTKSDLEQRSAATGAERKGDDSGARCGMSQSEKVHNKERETRQQEAIKLALASLATSRNNCRETMR
eukprot:3799011-Pleurochrysis_carterae.AAC.1